MIDARPTTGNTDTDPAAEATMSCQAERVTVTVPARLHLGFVDLNGGLGRRYGSLGIALDRPLTRLSVRRAAALEGAGPDSARALAHVRRLVRHFAIDDRLQLEVEAAIPDHIGLGSGTQLALATGIAVTRFFDLDADAWTIARLLDRGARSSIGIATFEQGGVILDGGRGSADAPPPVIGRLPFPDDWRILLIFDRGRRGLHGPAEIEAFRRLPPFPAELSAHLCRLALMVAMPALAERDLDRFGGAVAELQQSIGDYFAPAQGARFSSPAVADVLAWLDAEGVRGVGQSSWGPTGFALVASQADAEAFVARIRRRWPKHSGLSLAISSGRNRGGEVERLSPAL